MSVPGAAGAFRLSPAADTLVGVNRATLHRTAGIIPPVDYSRPFIATVAPTATTPATPWRRSVLSQITAASRGVDTLARRIGRFDVTHITGNLLPQVETTHVASR